VEKKLIGSRFLIIFKKGNKMVSDIILFVFIGLLIAHTIILKKGNI